ncbi:hypothetical protein ACMGE6_10630 [Macrococcus equi]|uniref:hypothetical protein n=1 Tax=Macrococcus equi TaxID=3395462 RepID=UPI0039BECE8F
MKSVLKTILFSIIAVYLSKDLAYQPHYYYASCLFIMLLLTAIELIRKEEERVNASKDY